MTLSPDNVIIGMVLFAIETTYGDIDERRDVYRAIMECYVTCGPYTIYDFQVIQFLNA